MDRTLPAGPGDTSPAHDALTARQRQILRYVAEGLSMKEIARKLRLSPRTIEYHQQRIRQRLGVRGVVGMVRYAIRNGLIDP